MRVVSTVHGASSVVRSAKAERADGTPLLFVASLLHLEAFELTETGISSIARLGLNARTLDLQPLAGAQVVLTTDAPETVALVIELEEDRLVVRSSVDMSTRTGKPADNFHSMSVFGKYAFSWHYSARLSCLDFDTETDGPPEHHDCPIQERTVFSACVAAETSKGLPILAILHLDSVRQKRSIVTRAWSDSNQDLGDPTGHVNANLVCAHTNTLVPLRTHQSILTLGGASMRLFRVRTQIAASPHKRRKKEKLVEREQHEEECSSSWDWGDVAAWTMVDDALDTRLLVADCYGRLVLLTVRSLQSGFTIQKVLLGQVSPPTTLSYLDNGVIFVGSHYGDSQLVKLLTASRNGSYVQVVETFTNLAPILDATLVDDPNSNQAQVITCSGLYSTGSLRVVQKNANTVSMGSIEGATAFPQASNVFPLRHKWNDPQHAFILVSSPHDTKFAAVTENGLEGKSSPFITNERTLAAGNFVSDQDDSLAVQVTPTSIILVSMKSGKEVRRLGPFSNEREEIVLASCSLTVVMLVRRNGTISYCCVGGAGSDLAISDQNTYLRAPEQVSALAVDSWIVGRRSSKHFAFALWRSKKVSINVYVDFLAGRPSPLASVELPSAVCSLVWTNFEQGKTNGHLFAGCVNGTVVICRFTDKLQFEGPLRTVGLGNLPVTLMKDGARVIACGSGAATFSWSDGRMQQSGLAVKDARIAVPINAPGFEKATIFITRTSLQFAKIGDTGLHIKTVNMGADNPRRIAHDPVSRTFGVGCVTMDILRVGEEERWTSTFKVLDQDSMEVMNGFSLNEREDLMSVASLPIVPGDDKDSPKRAVFVVGTAYIKPNEPLEPSSGRLVVYADSEEAPGKYWQAADVDVPGAAYSLTSVDGVIVAAVNTSVRIYELARDKSYTETALKLTLKPLKQWDSMFIVTSVAAQGNDICVGDTVQSVTVLRWQDGALQQVSKHYSPIWPTTVSFLGPNRIIAMNDHSNMYTFRQKQDDHRELEIDGGFHLGEQVNKFMSGSLTAAEQSSMFVPQQLFVTSTGCIGSIAEANDETSAKLYALQRNMTRVLGQNLPKHERWRAPHGEVGWHADAQSSATGFLDGDLLGRFFSIQEDSEEYQRIVAGENEAEQLEDPEELKLKLLTDLQALQG